MALRSSISVGRAASEFWKHPALSDYLRLLKSPGWTESAELRCVGRRTRNRRAAKPYSRSFGNGSNPLERSSPVADDLDRDPTDEERDALIEKIAGGVHRKHMETAAVLFLELHKPLAFIGSQALIVGSPLVGPFVGIENVHRVS